MKLRQFEFSGREAVGVFLLLLFTLSAASFVQRPFLESGTYAVAQQVKESLAGGQQASFFIQATAAAYKLAALATGTAGFSSSLLVSLLSFLPLLIALLTSLFLYFALRERGFAALQSLTASLIFSSTPLFLLMNSTGVYTAQSLALLFCAAALFVLSEKNLLRSLASGILLSLAYPIYPNSLVFGAVVFLASGAGALLASQQKERWLPLAALALPLAAALIALPQPTAPITDLLSLYSDFRLSLPLAAASLAVLLGKFREARDAFPLALLLLAVPAGIFMPLAMPLMLALPAALGATALLSNENSKMENVLAWFTFLLFLILSFLNPAADPARELLLSAIAAAGLLLILYIYEFKYHLVPFSACALLLVLSLSSSLLVLQSPSLQLSSAKHFAYSSIDADTATALAWVGENAPADAKIAFIGDKGPFLFLSERASAEGSDALLAKFLASGTVTPSSLKSAGIDYIIVTVDIFDRPERVRSLSDSNFNPESYSYFLTLSAGGVPTEAVFRSASGDLLSRPLDETGKLALGDSLLRDSSLNVIALVPFSQLRMLNDTLEYTRPENRVVRPGAAYSTNAFRIFFEDVPGLQKAYANTNAIVLRVE